MRWLAVNHNLNDPAFVAYLKYLLYWTKPPYLQYLSYPGPTLHSLKLLQQEDFRRALLTTDVAIELMIEETKRAFLYHKQEERS